MDIQSVPSLSAFIKGLPKEKYSIILNMRLLDAFPKICVKAEGFRKLKDALFIPQYHKRRKALEALLAGDVRKRVGRRCKEEAVDKSYIQKK